jgi:putative sigma-54 modulation protein
MKKGRRTQAKVSVRVKGKNMVITPALRELVEHKMGRLDKYHDRLREIEVELCTEKTREASRHNHVEATTYLLGRTIRVTAEDDEMYAAIDEAVDKLYRQLNRQKERLKAHHGVKLAEALPVEETAPAIFDEAVELGPDAVGAPVILTERLEVKPLFEDEAVLEMDAQAHDFYVFLNARSERLNVLYRRGDGTYGLIEPVPG